MDENRLHHLIRGWTLALEVQDGSLGYLGSVFGRGKKLFISLSEEELFNIG